MAWMFEELHPALLFTISMAIMAFLWYKSSLFTSNSLPPGPLSLPIVGYLPFLGHDLHKQFTKMGHTYGPIFKFYLGSKLHVVINSSEFAKKVVRDHDETFANRGLTVAAYIITYGGQDIVWSKNNSSWRKLRKIFVHEALSSKNLEACRCFRRDEVRKTIKNVFCKMNTAIDINKISFLTEASVLASMIWGNTSGLSSKDVHGDLGAELQTVAMNIVDIFARPNLSDFFPFLARFDLQGVERDMKKQLDKIDQILETMIENRNKSNPVQDGVEDHQEKKDFLQILLDLKNKNTDSTSLSITQIKALLLDFMLAGSETTATLIEWAMAEIMQNGNVMKRVKQELSEIVGINNMVEESHLPKLEYLVATIKETLRLHPVVPFLIPRSPSEDCKVGGYRVPKDCTVYLNVWAIHRDPKYWENPMEFNPERFMGTRKWDYKGSNLNFFPFGAGRRLCAGLPLAEKMMMFILASLLHSFEWRLPEGEEHDLAEKFSLTLRKMKPLVAIPSQRLSDVSLYT